MTREAAGFDIGTALISSGFGVSFPHLTGIRARQTCS